MNATISNRRIIYLYHASRPGPTKLACSVLGLLSKKTRRGNLPFFIVVANLRFYLLTSIEVYNSLLYIYLLMQEAAI